MVVGLICDVPSGIGARPSSKPAGHDCVAVLPTRNVKRGRYTLIRVGRPDEGALTFRDTATFP